MTTNNISVDNLDELERQKKQTEMIRQYLQVANSDSNSVPKKPSVSESDSLTTSIKNK